MESRNIMNKYMLEAHNEALKNQKYNFKDGGPFGAVIVKDGQIIAKSHNTVLKDHDATAHAEINVIRIAGQVLGTHDLSDCQLYTTCYPCPMCLAAIIWSNIKEVYYGNTKEDAGNIGFRDNYIYQLLNEPHKALNLIPIDRENTIQLFQEFQNNKNIY